MRCTPNELLALLNRALRSIPEQGLDGDAVARNVVALELRGLNGVSALLAQLQNPPALVQRDIFVAGSDAVCVAGGSLLLWAPQIVDQARCRADPMARVTLRIDSSQDPLGLLPELLRAERDRWHAGLAWADSDSGRQCLLRLEAGALDPWYGHYPQAEGPPLAHESLLLLTLEGALAGKRQPEPHGIEWLVTPETFAGRRFEALVKGLHIHDDDWARLSQYADRALVESSDQSRKGAGE